MEINGSDQLCVQMIRVFKVLFMHTWSAICMQMVECSDMYICIFVFIFVHTNGTVLAICLPMEKGSTIYHTRLLLYGHPRLLGMEGLLQQWLHKGDHICLWAAVIYFWSLLWVFSILLVTFVFLSSNHTSGMVIGWLGDKFPIFLVI